MTKGKLSREPVDGRSMECGARAGDPWDHVTDCANELSHLVQSGRRVSKEEMKEVEERIRVLIRK